VRTSCFLVLTCAATLLSNPLAALANDLAAPLSKGRSIVVLAQATQNAKPALSAQCRQNQVRRCNTVAGQQKCACVPKGESPRAMKGKPQTIIHGSDTPGPR
jgi:hypothetical protein